MSATPADVQIGMVFQIRPGYAEWFRSRYFYILPPFAEHSIVEAVQGGYETTPGEAGQRVVCARVKAIGTSAAGLVPVRFLQRRRVVK